LLSGTQSLSDWEAQHQIAIDRLSKLLQNIGTQGPDLAPISVALRELRHLA